MEYCCKNEAVILPRLFLYFLGVEIMLAPIAISTIPEYTTVSSFFKGIISGT